MKKKVIVVVVVLLLLLGATAVYAHGLDSGKLENAGWDCSIAGPHNWVHCFPPGAPMIRGQATTVKVFDCHDPCIVELDENDMPTGNFTGAGHPFLGTELLLRDEVYGGQPCMADGGEEYHLLELPPGDFRACHHFDTSDHDH